MYKKKAYSSTTSSQNLHRNIHHLITDIINKPLPKPIKPTRTTHAPSQNPIDDKVHSHDIWKLNALNEEAIIPIPAYELSHSVSGQI